MKTNALVTGPIGSGKGWCCRTLLAEYPDADGRIRKGAGLSNVLLSATEPGWEATNGDLTCQMGWHVSQNLPARDSIEEHVKWLEEIETREAEDIQKYKVSSEIRRKYSSSYINLFKQITHFECERCGRDFGDVRLLGEDSAFISDGLTGLTKIGWHFTVGPKPSLTWPQTDTAQHHILNYLETIYGLRCSTVLVAHWSREPREVEGGSIITVDTVGQKLAPKIVRVPDEIILAVRTENTYTWDLNNPRIDQKARRLPYRNGLEPTFAQIFRP